MVFSGLSTAWRLASWPTRRSPVLVNATTEGVKRFPSLLIITVGFPPSITATTEFVVPRSMPTAFAIPHLTMNNSYCSFSDLAYPPDRREDYGSPTRASRSQALGQGLFEGFSSDQRHAT